MESIQKETRFQLDDNVMMLLCLSSIGLQLQFTKGTRQTVGEQSFNIERQQNNPLHDGKLTSPTKSTETEAFYLAFLNGSVD